MERGTHSTEERGAEMLAVKVILICLSIHEESMLNNFKITANNFLTCGVKLKHHAHASNMYR